MSKSFRALDFRAFDFGEKETLSDKGMSCHDPVFLLGTGRCGSTHLQRAISLLTYHWIWGEHDGFIKYFVEAAHAFEQSKPLRDAVFFYRPTDGEMLDQMRDGSPNISWLNRISRNCAREAVGGMLVDVFGKSIPEGFTGWGFKEILYGLDDDVPRFLLNLFPLSRIGFTFRDPIETVASMIGAWTDLEPSSDSNEIESYVRTFSDRWLTVMSYFTALHEVSPDKIVFLPLPILTDLDKVLRRLAIPTRAKTEWVEVGTTNRNVLRKTSALLILVSQRQTANYGTRLREMYEFAADVSRRQFADA